MQMFRLLSAIAVTALFSAEVTAQTGETKEEAAPEAVSFVIEEGALVAVRGGEKIRVPLPEKATGVLAQAQRLFVSVGELGVYVFTLDPGGALPPPLEKRIPLSHGGAVGLFESEGAVWMKVTATTAVQLTEGTGDAGRETVTVTPAPPPMADAPELMPSSPPPAASASASADLSKVRIVSVMPGVAKLDAGGNIGIENGDRLAVYRRFEEVKADGVAYASEKRVAILEVIAVSEETALAALHRGERLAPGDTVAALPSEERPAKMFPGRLAPLAEVSINLRPIINVDNESGFGALADISATYWGKAFFAGVRIQPLGFGWTRQGGVLSTSVLAEGGYDRKEFAVGLGVGFGATTGDMDEMIGGYGGITRYKEDGSASDEALWSDRKKLAFTLAQVIRLGPKDGLNLVVVNRLMYYNPSMDQPERRYYDYADEGFKYAGTTARMAIPMTHVLDLVLEGGGGRMGYAYGAIGVSAWLKGRGDTGSIALSVSAGGASVWGAYKDDDGVVDEVFLVGPMIGIGLKARFGPKLF